MKATIDFMIIAAHPDDIEFGCAGSVAKWIEQGKSVVYVLCTSGDKGTSNPEISGADLAKRREAEQIAAAAEVGVSKVVFLRYPDQGVEDNPQFRKDIVRQMREFRPETVITMDPYKKYIWHRDHRITGRVVLDAVFPFVRDPLAYPDLLAAGYTPHKVREIWFFGSEEPNITIDISNTFDLKMKALYQHTSQIDEMGQKNVEGWVKERCLKMAKGTEFQYAEAFHRVTIPA